QLPHILPDDIKLQIHRVALAALGEICGFVGIWDDGHRDGAVAGVKAGQADAVNGDRSLLYSYVFQGRVICTSEEPASIDILNAFDHSGLVDMSLYDMSVESPVVQHATLQVHLITLAKKPQRRFFQCFSNRCNTMNIFFDGGYREADAIMRHTLINLQF